MDPLYYKGNIMGSNHYIPQPLGLVRGNIDLNLGSNIYTSNKGRSKMGVSTKLVTSCCMYHGFLVGVKPPRENHNI